MQRKGKKPNIVEKVKYVSPQDKFLNTKYTFKGRVYGSDGEQFYQFKWVNAFGATGGRFVSVNEFWGKGIEPPC